MGATSLLMAEPPPPFGPGELNKMWSMEDSIFSQLNLTTEQMDRIQALRASLEKEMAPLRAEKYERIAELSLLLMDPNPDGVKIKARMKAFHDLLWQIIEKETDYRLSLRGIFTQDQYEKYLNLSEFGRFPK